MNNKIELIRKINKTIVRKDGTFDNFDKQLIKLMSGVFDVKYPMVVSADSRCVSYVDNLDFNAPLVMNVSTVIKIKDKHEIGYEFVSNCEQMLKESVLAFESLKFQDSLIFVLDELDSVTGNPIIAICRKNKHMGLKGFYVNEITSIYDKRTLSNLLVRTYTANKTKKTEQYFTPNGLQLPQDIKYALCNYYKPSFNKSQVEKALKSKQCSKGVGNIAPLDEKINIAVKERRNKKDTRSDKIKDIVR